MNEHDNEKNAIPLTQDLENKEELKETEFYPKKEEKEAWEEKKEEIFSDQLEAVSLPLQKEKTLQEKATPIEENLSFSDTNSNGFVSTGIPASKKNPFMKGVIVFSILLVLGLIGYFIIYPFVLRTYFSNPKKVFQTTIHTLEKELISVIPDTHDKGIFDFSLQFDSSILEFQKYVGYTYSSQFGFDKENKEISYGIKKEDVSFNQSIYLKDNNYYAKFSTNQNELLALGNDFSFDATTSTLFSSLSYLEQLKKEDLSYVIQFFSNSFIKNMEDDYLSREEASISINGESFKVTRNLYTMDYNTKVHMIHSICDSMLQDEKLLSIFSSFSNMSEEQLKERILAYKEKYKEDERKDSLLFSIFTYGNKSSVIGYEIKNATTQFHYYQKDGQFNGYFSSSPIIDGEKHSTKVALTGVKKQQDTHVLLNVNEEDCLQLIIHSFTPEEIHADYTLYQNTLSPLTEDVSGSFLITKKAYESKNVYTLELSTSIEEYEVKAILQLDWNWNEEVSNINVSSASFKEKEDYIRLEQQFLNQILSKTPLSYFFSTLSGSYDQDIYNYYSQDKEKNLSANAS